MIDYNLVRSKRKTIGITVKDGVVIVKAPLTASKRSIDEFVDKSSEWIKSGIERYSTMQLRYKDFFECKKFLYLGNIVFPEYVSARTFAVNETAMFIPKNHVENAVQKIAAAYKKAAKEFLFRRLACLSDSAKLSYDRVSLTSAKGKWGSCNSNKLIRLNWRLMFLPVKLIDYVIMHELCHTKHMNHSSDFWNELARFIPDYKQRKKLLNDCSALIELYR